MQNARNILFHIRLTKFCIAFRKEIEAIKQEGGGSHSYINSYLNEIEKNKTLNLGNTFNGMHFSLHKI